jgi:hypothetical protein
MVLLFGFFLADAIRKILERVAGNAYKAQGVIPLRASDGLAEYQIKSPKRRYGGYIWILRFYLLLFRSLSDLSSI